MSWPWSGTKDAKEPERKAEDLERALGALRPRPAPPNLKTRILAAAGKARGRRVMTPRMWQTVAVCVALIVTAVIGDSVISGHQEAAILGLARGAAASRSAEGNTGILRVETSWENEVPGGSLLEKRLAVREILARTEAGRKSLAESLEAIKRMKGWIEYEAAEIPD